MRHLLAIAARLGMSPTFFTSAALIVAGLSVSGSAQALSFCDSKTPCGAGSQCYGWLCVPTAAVCNPAAPACASWQTCDMTCKVMGSSSGGTSTPDAGVAVDGSSGSGSGSSGGSSGSSGGSGGAPMPPADGGSSDKPAPPPDAGSTDASYPDDAKSPMPELDGGGSEPPANCPKDFGVCLPDPVKIVAQPGCEQFCMAIAKCGGFGGGDSTDPDEGPPPMPGDAGPAPSVDAGSSSADAGSGFAPKPEDAGSADGSAGDKMIPPDGGSADVPPPSPDPDQVKSCVQICSVVKLGGYAKVEFAAMEQCIAKGAPDCQTLETSCAKEAQAFETAIKGDAGLELALMALGGGGSDSGGSGGTGVPEPGKDSDASAQSGSDATSGSVDTALGADAGSSGGESNTATDGGSGAPQNLDTAAGKDSSSAATGSAASAAKSDGCTANPAAAQPGALALLLGGLVGLVRRRKLARVRA